MAGERRDRPRRRRRVEVSFWERGSEKRHRGYSANISAGGMYIETRRPLPRGRRIRLEVGSNGQGFLVEAAVARVNKSFKSLTPSGMGVRFVEIEQLVGELTPEVRTSGPADQPPLPPDAYRLRFDDRQQFYEVYDRDLATGGLFVPTDEPAPLNEVVTIELSVVGEDVAPVVFQARVVRSLDGSMADGSDGNVSAGMGVELLSFEQTLPALWTLVAQLVD